MNKLLIVLTLMLFGCTNDYNGKEIDYEVAICTQITEYKTGKCQYTFLERMDGFTFCSECGKWQIGDTL